MRLIQHALNLRLFQILILAAVLIHPFLYFSHFAGDAVIHLIYAKNLAAGHAFEFNLGEKSAGVTSIGYMVWVATLFKLFPESWVPMILKLTNIAAWYGLLWLTFLIARRLLADPRMPWLVLLIMGIMPGSAYNATIGMENVVFGFVLLLWLLKAIDWGWFSQSQIRLRRLLLLGILLGFACTLRPEGIPVLALATAVRAWVVFSETDSVKKVFSQIWLIVLIGAFFVAPMLLFHHAQTGLWLPNSASARITISNNEALHLGLLPINTKFAVRLIFFFPLLFLWLIFNGMVCFRKITSRPLLFINLVFLTFFILYSTVLGAAHLARYVLFLMPLLAIICAATLDMISPKWKTHLLIATAVAMVILAVTEYKLRQDGGVFSAKGYLWSIMAAPESRHRISESYAHLDSEMVPPISIAVQEVQIKYWLDNRFVIRSLDGRIDARLLTFWNPQTGNIDHLGYLKALKIGYIFEFPNYNKDPQAWSLAELQKLGPTEKKRIGDLTFARLSDNPNMIKISYDKP